MNALQEVSLSLFINALGKQPDLSFYILSYEFKDWISNKDIFISDTEGELFPDLQ